MANIIKVLAILPFFVIVTCLDRIKVSDVYFDAQGGQKVTVADAYFYYIELTDDDNTLLASGVAYSDDPSSLLMVEHEWIRIEAMRDSESCRTLLVTVTPNTTGKERYLHVLIGAEQSYGRFIVRQSGY